MFSVGDRVRILNVENNPWGHNEDMTAMIGTVTTITEVRSYETPTVYKLEGSWWNWAESNFELVEKEKENKTMETLMNKNSNYEVDDKLVDALVMQAMGLLGKYGFEPDAGAVRHIIRDSLKAKAWMWERFSKHPNWDGKGHIILDSKLKRPLDQKGVRQFKDWFGEELMENMASQHALKIGLHDAYEYRTAMDKTDDIGYNLRYNAIYNGLTQEQWRDEYKRMNNVYETWKRKHNPYTVWISKRNAYVTVEREIEEKYSSILSAMCCLLSWVNDEEKETPNLIGENKAKRANEKLEAVGLTTRAVVGQRLNKVVGKILKELGMNHIVDKQTQTWADANGNIHSRIKDMGYNYHFALLGDSINPIEYERPVVISVNPIDFYTMSFGYNWASCHTIDKENTRHNGSDNYQGCYCGGTESEMLDGASIIMYVRPTEEQLRDKGEQDLEMEEQSKFKRCVFWIGEDKIVQSRVYPDGRDGGDEGLAAQLRAIMQKTIADLYDTPNMWTLKKGTSACCEAIYTEAYIHYPDYEHYDDCNVSYLRRVNGDLNHNCITVGHKIICVRCGSTHSNEDNILCEDCVDSHRCQNCGCLVRENEAYIMDDGNWYCSCDCAEQDGWVDTEDMGWAQRENCYYDSYEERWYYYDNNDSVSTYDGNWYRNERNAAEDGYMYADVDGEWYREDDVYSDFEGNTFYMPDHDPILIDGEYYLAEEDAERNGYELNENGEWVSAA